MSWTEVSEWMPNQHEKVLVSFEDCGAQQITCASYFVHKDKQCWQQDHEWMEARGGWNGATLSPEDLPVTHWDTLPEFPNLHKDTEALPIETPKEKR